MGARLIGLVVAACLAAGAARASGPGWLSPWYVDQFGGDAADLAKFYDGRVGIVMARAPKPQLFISWRLLHGQAVGAAAGRALSEPCCSYRDPYNGSETQPRGTEAWREAHKLVPGAPALPDYIPMERDSEDYSVLINCFDEAFELAAATLKDRAARYGTGSAAVWAWLAGQDVVFAACGKAGVVMPALPTDAPEWLKADRAYQDAALALYDGRHQEAAERFAAIGRDKRSPWAASGLYLTARARVRGAIAERTPARDAAAQAAIKALAAAPVGTFGQGEARGMARMLAYRTRPAELLGELDKELNARMLAPDVAVAFRDYAGLGRTAARRPDAIDWIMTLSPEPDPAKLKAATDGGEEALAAEARLRLEARGEALAHARARWAASRDVAWLIAALSLVEPGAPEAAGLAQDAAAVKAEHPGWVSVQHHLARLTLTSAEPATSRARLDAVLAKDLSVSDRNVFSAHRAQVAADRADFVRFALRRRLCADTGQTSTCARERWLAGDDYQASGIYDGKGAEGTVGLGEDARAVIDRLPLAERIALSKAAGLPAAIRLDVALTSYARAVQLKDDGAIDVLAADLVALLPQLAADWKRIVASPPGADKRFATYVVMAKIPGLRVDLVEYVRPEGTVPQFQRYWMDWIILARPVKDEAPPALAAYQEAGAGVSADDPDRVTDLACLGECGRGAAPLRPPEFAKAGETKALAERGWFFSPDMGYDQPPKPVPPGGVAVWDEMLAYVAAHPKDSRAPEALYWLVRVGRYGGSHNHSGKRAFQLLHAKYGQSSWAKRTPYFYD